MILGLYTASDQTIDRIVEHPVLIWQLDPPDDSESGIIQPHRKPKWGLVSRILGKSKQPRRPAEPPELDVTSDERNITDLDKAWHGIHFLLTGSAWEGDPPLNFLVCGGRKVGDIDIGYGPARVFRAIEVHGISCALSIFSPEVLKERFDPVRMTQEDIYPTIWNRDPSEDDALGYLLEYFAVLKDFVQKAADRNLGLVITIE